MEKEFRELVRDFINCEIKENEMMNKFDLKYCAVCGCAEFEEDLLDTETMVNGGIGFVCQNCLEDMKND